jgi:lipopolysaccharide/colanic/teichoic acid biosynthesis glycosyltransferase
MVTDDEQERRLVTDRIACLDLAEPAAPRKLPLTVAATRHGLKRAQDVALAAVLLLLLAAPLAMIALAVRVEGPGPVLFAQRRTGLHGREFTMLKFRTMHHRMADPAASAQTRRGDARVTAVGWLLRRSSMDELPQLLNVLRGDMALVGPRPHATGMRVDGRPVAQAAPRYAARHLVRPGLTGLAQVRGQRGAAESRALLAARLASDLEYIDTWTLRGDLLILLRTAVSVARMRDAW